MKKYFAILGLCFAFSANASGLCDEKFLKEDYAGAKDFCLTAANQGDADAQLLLGAMYHDGQGLTEIMEALSGLQNLPIK